MPNLLTAIKQIKKKFETCHIHKYIFNYFNTNNLINDPLQCQILIHTSVLLLRLKLLIEKNALFKTRYKNHFNFCAKPSRTQNLTKSSTFAQVGHAKRTEDSVPTPLYETLSSP